MKEEINLNIWPAWVRRDQARFVWLCCGSPQFALFGFGGPSFAVPKKGISLEQ